MAHDHSEPKSVLILKVTGGAIVSLVIIRAALGSYFHTMEDDVRAQRQTHATRDRPGEDPATRDSISVSMKKLVDDGEKSVVHPVTSGPMVRPCWAGAKCDDPPTPNADAGAGVAPTPTPPPAPTPVATDAGAPVQSDGGGVKVATDAGPATARDAGNKLGRP
jgi:hypothetical protein